MVRDGLASPENHDVTQLIQRVRQGDKNAESALISLVYPELRAIAARLLRGERPEHTFQTTDLVHEAYLRLARGSLDLHDRIHFFAVASQVMRHVLVDHARKILAGRRGGCRVPLELDEALVISRERLEDLILLEDLLSRLEKTDQRASQVVILRVYGGMSIDEIAAELKVSARTVKRDWNYTRAWLQLQLGSSRAKNAARA
jgi:RNA polymerase sigma factor (TIGR02999 family)